MIKKEYKRFFDTLGNKIRLNILYQLSTNGSMSVSALTKKIGCKQSTISHNLKKLSDCRFVHIRAEGQYRYYSLNKKTIEPLMRLIDTHVKTYCAKTCHVCEKKKE